MPTHFQLKCPMSEPSLPVVLVRASSRDNAARVMALLEQAGCDPRLSLRMADTGSLIRAVRDVAPEARVEAVELNAALAAELGRLAMAVRCADFLSLNGELGRFDRIVMNPPFSHGDDIKHIEHARAKLKPGGRLVAICANGPRQREKLGPIAAEWIDLPAGSFSGKGTSVSAAIVVIDGPPARLPRRPQDGSDQPGLFEGDQPRLF
ncbi:MAG: hypothetical protein JWO38_4798 [Gemmataceae bacterium]|nr:hypothetical protein [Gemmataceae bacterium]